MSIKEAYENIFCLSENINVNNQYEIDKQIDALIEKINNEIHELSIDEKEKILLPLLKDFHAQRFRSLTLRTLENVSTMGINNLLLGEVLLEDDVSGVIPYLRLFVEPNCKDIVKNKINDIYLSGKIKFDTKEFNNLCTLLFYIGVRKDVVDKMKNDLRIFNGTSRELLAGILEKENK